MIQRKDVSTLWTSISILDVKSNLTAKVTKQKTSTPCGSGPRDRYVDNVRVGPAFMRLIVLGVLEEHLVHVGAGVLEQLIGTVEDDERYFTVTEHAEFIGFLH